jgi:hypothetical protein
MVPSGSRVRSARLNRAISLASLTKKSRPTASLENRSSTAIGLRSGGAHRPGSSMAAERISLASRSYDSAWPLARGEAVDAAPLVGRRSCCPTPSTSRCGLCRRSNAARAPSSRLPCTRRIEMKGSPTTAPVSLRLAQRMRARRKPTRKWCFTCGDGNRRLRRAERARRGAVRAGRSHCSV